MNDQTETDAVQAQAPESGINALETLARKPGKFLVLSDNLGRIGWDAVYENEQDAIDHIAELEPSNCGEAFIIPISAFFQRD